MILAIRIYQILVVCVMLYSIIKSSVRKKDRWRYMHIAQWVYYLSGVIATTLSFGVIGILEETQKSIDDIFVCLIFIAACTVATILMVLQKMWRVKYNSETLIFRNAFGRVKQYKIKELTYSEKGRLCTVLHNGRKVIQWDTLIMNHIEEVLLCRVLPWADLHDTKQRKTCTKDMEGTNEIEHK